MCWSLSSWLQNTFKYFTHFNPCNLLNSRRLAVFLFSCYTWGNRGTKKLSSLPKVIQSLMTGHLTPESLFIATVWYWLMVRKGSTCSRNRRRPVWLEYVRGGGWESYEDCQVEAGAKLWESWWANKKFGFYSNDLGTPLGNLKQGSDITWSIFLKNYLDFCSWKDGIECFFSPVSKTKNTQHYIYNK